MTAQKPRDRLRIGEAAEALDISTDTLRRWIEDGRVAADRTSGGQRTVAREEVNRLLAERRRAGGDRPIVAVEELDLQPGSKVVCVVKATNVMVEVPS